ncbi:ubiquinol-cytochrome c reductase iron-sulfur subunit [Halolamina litorea]|uniref:Ubiquinol-cytochrome c reductase iron-sulfur subunit n=1 Tax=Halolamina litorea TaxID=1515593 RepID=A0ABD6BVU2_9EURY|nr:ubiquinol-cytochrome c reductase iron-sulfur subunit [Halolamina litorea]
MSADEDKYPAESGRRRFVKGVVGGAGLAAVGMTGAVGVNTATTSPGEGGGSTTAMAIENTAGPAPRGMPQIPVEVDDEGYVKGVWPEVEEVDQGGRTVEVAEMEMGGKTYSSEWFQYCGVESYQGIVPSYESENYFRSDSGPGYEWQSSELEGGDRLNVEMFDDYESWGNGIGDSGLGKPATGRWRSEDTENTIPIQVIRSPIIEDIANGNTDADQSIVDWLSASTDQGFIAWLNKCTHFCCVPGYKQDPSSSTFNGEDGSYCACHQSVYDPFSIVETLFVARPRPE